ncbi:glycosyl transferase family 2 [Rhodopirellula islandica]|uniref:Glycosyl transferase family 2 n=1 Tax=Rhodopirellula islandica TaxID=595434 RepID=A0A0J1B889_RHOIS|nr:glycosyltransferase [Rhodopirellula islandica]KLU02671.1 glycosyl transferase family 2 [Rhodopirellula islandica]
MNESNSPSPPKISVLLPVFNAKKTVGETIDSILGQTEANFEFLILDDGSTDGSCDVALQAAQNDSRVQLIRQSNAGMAVSLNRLIDQSRGQYLARIDADDVAEPTRFATQVAYLDAHPDCVLVGSAVLNIDGEGDPYGVTILPADHDAIETRLLSGAGGVMHPSTMLRREAVIQTGGFALNYPVAEDQDLWLRLARIGRLANLPEPLTRYRVHPQNMSFVRQTDGADALDRLLAKAHADRGLPYTPSTNQASAETVCSAWDRQRTWAWTAVQEGYLLTARKHARRLTRQRPLDARAWKLLAASHFPRLFALLRSKSS